MKALFRKHIEQALIPAAVLAVLAGVLIGSDRNLQLTTRPNADGAALIAALLWGLFGMLVGFAGFALEESRGARAYWLHRGVGARRAFVAKTSAELAALALALLFVIVLDAILTDARLDPAFDPPPMRGRYVELAVGAASTLLGHALGSLGAQMRRPIVVRLLSTAFAGSGAVLLTAIWQIHMGEPRMSNVVAWLVWMLGGATWLYALAAHAFVQGPDEDRPLSGVVRSSFAHTALALGGTVCLLVVVLLQRHANFEAVRRLPWVAYANGEASLRDEDRNHGDRWNLSVFDPLERPESRTPDPQAWFFSLGDDRSPFAFGDEWRQLTNRAVRRDTGAGVLAATIYFGARSGCVLVSAERLRSTVPQSNRVHADGRSAAPYVAELRRGDGRRFSREVAALRPNGEGSDWALYDGEDRTLWRLDLAVEAPRLAPLELPHGDRPLGLDADVRVEQERISWNWRMGGSTTVVRGQRARYRWTGEGFEPFEPALGRVWQTEYRPALDQELVIEDDDLLAPRVSVIDTRTGAVLLEHEYQPTTLYEGLASALATLRSPLGLLASTSRDRRSGIRNVDLFFDPLVANGRRPWLVAINLALSSLLAWTFARRRLLGLRWTWWVVLAVLGPGVIAIAGVIEPRRRREPPSRSTRAPVIRELAHAPVESAAT